MLRACRGHRISTRSGESCRGWFCWRTRLGGQAVGIPLGSLRLPAGTRRVPSCLLAPGIQNDPGQVTSDTLLLVTPPSSPARPQGDVYPSVLLCISLHTYGLKHTVKTFSNLNCMCAFTTFVFLVSNRSYSSFRGITFRYTEIIWYSVPSEMGHRLAIPLLIDSKLTSGFCCYKQ